MWRKSSATAREPEHLPGAHEVGVAQREHRGAHDADEDRDPADADRKRAVEDARPERGHDRQREQDRRDREEDVARAHDQRRGRAAEVAGDDPADRAEDAGDQRRDARRSRARRRSPRARARSMSRPKLSVPSQWSRLGAVEDRGRVLVLRVVGREAEEADERAEQRDPDEDRARSSRSGWPRAPPRIRRPRAAAAGSSAVG